MTARNHALPGCEPRCIGAMVRTMRKHKATKADEAFNRDGLCDWVESLPYVVRRAHGLSRTASVFDVSCRPLERRLTWLVVERAPRQRVAPTRIAALLPRSIAEAAERSELGVCTVPMHPDRVLFRVDPLADRADVESLVLAAYGAAMS
jgi:hypothetical protein